MRLQCTVLALRNAVVTVCAVIGGIKKLRFLVCLDFTINSDFFHIKR
jgi:hypothetical protein